MKKEWFHCLHCERCFQSEVPDDYQPGIMIEEIGEMTLDEGGEEMWRCPYKGCDGTPLDFTHWSEVRENNLGYPAIPKRGHRYPINGE